MKKKFLAMILIAVCATNISTGIAYGLEGSEVKENIQSEEVKENIQNENVENIENTEEKTLENEGENIGEKQGKEKLSLKESSFKYVKDNEYVITLKDKKGATHKITNIGLEEEAYYNQNMRLKTKVIQPSTYNKDRYILQEVFVPDGQGNVKYLTTATFDTYGYKNIELRLNSIKKDMFKGQKYFYLRTGVTESKDSMFFSDVVSYKVLNPFYEGYYDIEGHYAEKIIMDFSKKGYINGYSDKTFRPNNAITRAEFIKITNKYFGYKNNKVVEKFNDVEKNHWFYNEVNIALNAGYISGSNSTFRPNDPISREEVASIVTSIKKKKDNNLDKIKALKDYNEISNWARSSVEGSIEAGYMGKGGITFRPKDNITRAEAVTTLSRIK